MSEAAAKLGRVLKTADGKRLYRVRHRRPDPERYPRYQGSTTVEVVSKKGKVLAVGEAVCSRRDVFQRARGREVALARALLALDRGEPFRGPRWERPPRALGTDVEIDRYRLLMAASKQADETGLSFVHFADDGPPVYVVMTEARYESICARLFGPGGMPATDPEWAHDHITPDQLAEMERYRSGGA